MITVPIQTELPIDDPCETVTISLVDLNNVEVALKFVLNDINALFLLISTKMRSIDTNYGYSESLRVDVLNQENDANFGKHFAVIISLKYLFILFSNDGLLDIFSAESRRAYE